VLHVGLPALPQAARPHGWRAKSPCEREGPAHAPVHSYKNVDPAAQLRRAMARIGHSRQTEQIKAGLVGLLMLCANASDGRRKADLPLTDIQWKMQAAARRPHAALRAFGARPLRCGEAPGLYAILLDICMRAGLRRMPELYLLPVPGMNAYALGGPDNACVSVTEDLLRGLSREEIAGIFAHEVAHILHHDDHAMKWASAVQHAITELASCGASSSRRRSSGSDAQAMLVAAAPMLARLLTSALSRVRELAADARAIDLIEHPGALIDALCKLEFFHTGLSPAHAQMRGPSASRALHSHPETWERIAQLS
jgi:heat shock protein HtpX